VSCRECGRNPPEELVNNWEIVGYAMTVPSSCARWHRQGVHPPSSLELHQSAGVITKGVCKRMKTKEWIFRNINKRAGVARDEEGTEGERQKKGGQERGTRNLKMWPDGDIFPGSRITLQLIYL
jgi:hypothetical protein